VTDINFKLDASLLGFGFCRRSKGYTVCSHSGVIFKVPLRSGLFSHISSQTKENTGGNCILSVRNRKKTPQTLQEFLHCYTPPVLFQLHTTLKVMLYFSCACHWRLRPFLYNHHP